MIQIFIPEKSDYDSYYRFEEFVKIIKDDNIKYKEYYIDDYNFDVNNQIEIKTDIEKVKLLASCFDLGFYIKE